MSAVLIKCRSIVSSFAPYTSFTLGVMGGNRFVRVILKPDCDWTGTQDQQLASYKKIALIVVQVCLTGATFMVLPAVSQACLPFFATYQIPFSSALIPCIQGSVVAFIGSLGDYLVKQANGNWTPNQEKRKLNLLGCDFANSFLSYLILIRLSWIQSTVLFSSTNRIVSMVYDLNPKKSSQVLSRLANKIADCFCYVIAKSYKTDQKCIKKNLEEYGQQYINILMNQQKYFDDMALETRNPRAYITKKEIEILTEEMLKYATEKMDQIHAQADEAGDRNKIKKLLEYAEERLERLKEPLHLQLYQQYRQENAQQCDREELLEHVGVELRNQLNQKYPTGDRNRIEEIIQGAFNHLRAIAKDDASDASDESNEVSEIKESRGDEDNEVSESEGDEGDEGDAVYGGVDEGDEVSEVNENEGDEGDAVYEGIDEGDEEGLSERMHAKEELAIRLRLHQLIND